MISYNMASSREVSMHARLTASNCVAKIKEKAADVSAVVH
jgi:hypothetical protein